MLISDLAGDLSTTLLCVHRNWVVAVYVGSEKKRKERKKSMMIDVI